MASPTRSDLLVGVQFVAIGAIVAWPGAAEWGLPRVVRALAWTVFVAGGLLSVAGLLALGRDLTPFVTPRAGAPLRTGGAYAISRNPVYAGLLAAMVALAVLRARPEPLLAAVVLTVVLHLKTGAEEHRLLARFGAPYETYRARVPRLLGLPWRSDRR